MSREYWNDLEAEKKKSFWIEDVNDRKILRFLQEETNLERCFQAALDFAPRLTSRDLGGHILDVAAGVGWTSAIMSLRPQVERVYALDYSAHRLEKVCPLVCAQYGAPREKVVPIVADFFQERFDRSFDVVVFCQALYMFPNLGRTVRRAHALLKPGGLLIVAAERITPELPRFSPANIKRTIRRLIFGRADASGNNGYVDSEYRRAIERAGFGYAFQELDYPVNPKTTRLRAGNHFGVKAG